MNNKSIFHNLKKKTLFLFQVTPRQITCRPMQRPRPRPHLQTEGGGLRKQPPQSMLVNGTQPLLNH